jgi:hypothetical protein
MLGQVTTIATDVYALGVLLYYAADFVKANERISIRSSRFSYRAARFVRRHGIAVRSVGMTSLMMVALPRRLRKKSNLS